MNRPRIFDSQSQTLEQKNDTIDEEITAELKEEEIQLGWKAIIKEKVSIENNRKELLKMYVNYRKTLVQSIQEFNAETDTQFNLTKLIRGQQTAEKIKQRYSSNKEHKQSDVNDKIAIVQKVLAERRIKKYYKSKYHVDFHDQLDPENDEEKLYEFYYQKFAKYQAAPEQAPTTPFITAHHTPRPSGIIHPSEPFNMARSTHNQYIINYPTQRLAKNEDSFEQMKYLHIPSQVHPTNNFNDTFMGVANELSFDNKQEQIYTNNNIIDNLHLNLNFQDMLNTSKRMYTEEENVKEDRDNVYDDFVNRQKQQLQIQKMKVKELTEKAYKVLNNDDIDDEVKDEEQVEEQSKVAQFRYLIGELIQIFVVGECLKHHLKYKSYEILNKIYEHASQYYGEQIIFEEPLTVKYMSQIIEAILADEAQKGIRVVIENIFDKNEQISYDQFVDKLTSSINEKQYQTIEDSLIDEVNTNILDLTIRMFNLWIELDYFEQQVKDLLAKNKHIVDKFIEFTARDSIFNVNLLYDYIYKSKKINKLKKLKVQIFFRHIVSTKMRVSQFYRWFEVRKIILNESFRQIKEQEQYDYYYNLY